MLKNNILVSIHCITYNHEKYIRKCLDGFVMQKTDFRYEAIVHDDKSTDNTASIIREYAEKYPEIIKPIFEEENLFSKHNGSIRKKMDSVMSGEYVALCEGDDYWTDPYKLQKQVDFLSCHPECSMCYHNAIVDNGSSKHLFIDINTPSGDISLKKMLIRWSIPTASVMYRRDSCIYPTDYPEFINGDYAMELMLKRVGAVHYMADIMSVYQLHQESLSAYLNKDQSSLYQNIINLLSYISKLYPDDNKIDFEEAIIRYEKMKTKSERSKKYPYLRFLDWRFYKRLLFRKLRIKIVKYNP